jgi:hypothetical protein
VAANCRGWLSTLRGVLLVGTCENVLEDWLRAREREGFEVDPPVEPDKSLIEPPVEPVKSLPEFDLAFISASRLRKGSETTRHWL